MTDGMSFEPRYYTRDNKTGGAPSDKPSITNAHKAGDSAPHIVVPVQLLVHAPRIAPAVESRYSRTGNERTEADRIIVVKIEPPSGGKRRRGSGRTVDGRTPVAFSWQTQGSARTEIVRTGDYAGAVSTSKMDAVAVPQAPPVFVKKRRAGAGAASPESWKEGGPAPTVNCFDQGDKRSTVLVGAPVQGVNMQGSKGSALPFEGKAPSINAMHGHDSHAVAVPAPIVIDGQNATARRDDRTGTIQAEGSKRLNRGYAVAIDTGHLGAAHGSAKATPVTPTVKSTNTKDRIVIAYGISNHPTPKVGYGVMPTLAAKGGRDGAPRGGSMDLIAFPEPRVVAPPVRTNVYNNSDPTMEIQQMVTEQVAEAPQRTWTAEEVMRLAESIDDPAQLRGIISDLLGFQPAQPVEAPPMMVRRLTPTECCRLQGFPDGHTCLCQAGAASNIIIQDAVAIKVRSQGETLAIAVEALRELWERAEIRTFKGGAGYATYAAAREAVIGCVRAGSLDRLMEAYTDTLSEVSKAEKNAEPKNPAPPNEWTFCSIGGSRIPPWIDLSTVKLAGCGHSACGCSDSDSSRYRALGNAVAVPAVRFIAERIKSLVQGL